MTAAPTKSKGILYNSIVEPPKYMKHRKRYILTLLVTESIGKRQLRSLILAPTYTLSKSVRSFIGNFYQFFRYCLTGQYYPITFNAKCQAPNVKDPPIICQIHSNKNVAIITPIITLNFCNSFVIFSNSEFFIYFF